MAVSVAWESLAQWLLARSHELVAQWLSNGKPHGREWCVGDLKNEPGQSLRVNMDSGRWADFSTGQKGGDLIALWAAIHQTSQLEAARELAEKYGYGPLDSNVVPLRPALSDEPPDTTFELPPSNAPINQASFKHRKHGLPAHWYPYRTFDGSPIYVVARYETAAGKEFCPFTWREGRWTQKGPPKPRPLYGLDRLEKYPGSTVIVEGEKCANALQERTQKSSVLTWAGGAPGWKFHDWSPLRGRSVILWPDADPQGFSAMQGIAGLLLPLGCALQIVNTDGLPEAYDVADLLATGENLQAWLKPRLKAVERPAAAPARVQAPQSIGPAVTVDQDGKAVEAEPIYSTAARYGLSYSKAGVHANLANARKLIECLIEDGTWPKLFYDEFLEKTMYGDPAREWADHDTLRLCEQMQRNFGMTQLRKGVVEDAVNLYAVEHRTNSAREWLRSLKHDGTRRLESLFTRGFGAASNEYTRKAAKCFMIGMVARVLNRGCQVDTLPVLESSQGERKTSALRILGGEYFVECNEPASGKDFYLVIQGKMLVEIADFHAFNRADVDRVKGVITCRTDRYRAPYERRASDHLRSCVFVATTNRDDWNRDDTGARRFWPISCKTIDVEWIRHFRDQFFAEAVARFDSGEPWWDIPLDLARAEQDSRIQEDVLGRVLTAYIASRPNMEINVSEIMEQMDLKGAQRFDRQIQQRLVSTLRSWGYQSIVTKDGAGKTVRVWLKGSQIAAAVAAEAEEDEPDEPA